MDKSPAVVIAGLAGLAAFAFILCYQAGHLGGLVEDDLVIYGGWQIVNGQLPQMGSFASNPILVAMVQAVFYKMFGVNWTAGVLHAATFNAIWVILVAVFCRRLALPLWVCASYAIVGAYTYYTPVGFAHPDKDSFVYFLAALLLQLSALNSTKPRQIALRYGVAALSLVAAFVAKSNPSVLYPLAGLVPFLALDRRGMFYAISGVAAAVVILGLGIWVLDIVHPGFARDTLYYLVTLPLGVAAQRVAHNSYPSITKFGTYTSYSTLTLAWSLLIAGIGGALIGWRHWRDAQFRRERLVPLGLAASFMTITIFHLTHLAQPGQIHVPLVILAVAAVHGQLSREQSDWMARAPMALLLVGYVLIDAREYQRIVTRSRINFQAAFAADTTPHPPGYTGMKGYERVRWIDVADSDYLPTRQELMQTLAAIPGNVVLYGFWPAYYALAGKAPVLPTYLVIAGHTTPPVGSTQEVRLIERFKANLSTWKVNTLVMPKALMHPQWLDHSGMVCGEQSGSNVTTIHFCPGWTENADLVASLFRYSGKSPVITE